jgi:hypothetical protein
MTSPVAEDPYRGKAGRPGVADPRVVANFHMQSDADVSRDSQHHTLGISGGQASPGNHTHDGTSSVALLGGVTLTGAKAGNTALASVIAALVQLGATDATSA